jgi:hypothetical protein
LILGPFDWSTLHERRWKDFRLFPAVPAADAQSQFRLLEWVLLKWLLDQLHHASLQQSHGSRAVPLVKMYLIQDSFGVQLSLTSQRMLKLGFKQEIVDMAKE